ncbi:Cobalt-zinc-cadmium resistance protein CzcD [Rubellimicrobium mesophilum DSM 19309]|uniref:Cobalt-zinc-cadmium resistance protein CzcD n=1 Tax=Rubellimicrobium mesophilum DSM 19309 TaxID=442562 RepID=A0A017HLP0_9RHOB|nr:cation diffusion facilitator family transporter [Rubellimicrobium mesophilum]EYD75281.1 Cobalt-zinc-cadmium resistance protein CzcD [Rubellimicrobium mesophilum DSM 19309]
MSAHPHDHAPHAHGTPDHVAPAQEDGHAGHDHGHMTMRHAHAHDHHGDERRLLLALLLTGGFMVAEAVAGVLSGSLALLADAGHMLTDSAALALSWWAARVAKRPATPERSFGHHRFQVLAALVNGSALIVVALWIVVEAVRRLAEPVEVLGGTMLAVAVLGLLVNAGAFGLLHGGSQENLNIRGAVLHVLGDMLGSVGAIVAAGVILATGWTPIDPLLSVLVAVLILRSAWVLAGQAWHILMEGTPEGFDPKAISADLVENVPGVVQVDHVHLWSLTPERPLVTLDARITPGTDHESALHALRERLVQAHGLRHATIEVSRREA